MRVLALVVALLSVPAFAAEYTPWPGREPSPIAVSWVELAQQGREVLQAMHQGAALRELLHFCQQQVQAAAEVCL